MITTKINTEVTSITGTTSEGYPTTSTREVETTVQAASGQAIVIGGLLEKRTIESTDKIPLLGDIPLLGRVFSNVRSEEKETNLWVIITPYLIEKRGGGKGE
jgi:general secretion pathway protein D